MGPRKSGGGATAGRARIAIAAALAASATAGCYPGEISNVAETQVVITTYDTGFDYTAQRTYAIPDTVIEVCDVEVPDPTIPIDCDDDSRIDYNHAYDATLVARAVDNMDSLGYTQIPWDQVNESNLPDVALVLMVAVNEWTAYTYWGCGGYWGWWGWWSPGWGCWYPGYIQTTSWEQGTLFMDMFDPEEATQEGLRAVWTGAINSVLSSSSQQNLDLALSGIDQAFDQSRHYLMVQ